MVGRGVGRGGLVVGRGVGRGGLDVGLVTGGAPLGRPPGGLDGLAPGLFVGPGLTCPLLEFCCNAPAGAIDVAMNQIAKNADIERALAFISGLLN